MRNLRKARSAKSPAALRSLQGKEAVREPMDFRKWLKAVWGGTRDLQLAPALDAVSKLAGDTFDTHLGFVEMNGEHESHLAGARDDRPVPSTNNHIPLYGEVHLIPDNWGGLSESEQAKLVIFLRRLVFSKQVSLW